MKQKIKDICEKGSSNLKQKELLSEGKYPVFGAGGLSGYLNTYHQEREYIGIVKDGSGIGRVDFYPAKTSLIGTMQYIIPLHGFNIRYIGYCLQSLDLSKHKQGAAIPHIYFRDYGEQEVNITSDIAEQEEIVSRLDKAFEQIETMRRNAEQSLTTAQQLFQSTLTNLLTPQPHWDRKVVGKIKDICTKGSSNLKQKDLLNDGKYAVYGASGIAGYLNEYHQPSEYIGIVKDGSGIGRVDFYPKETSLIGTMQYILPLDGFNIRYVGYCLQSLDLVKFKQGAAIPHIYFRDYGEMTIDVNNNIEEQAEIVARLDSLSAKVKQLKDNHTRTVALCDEMKQALLKEVFE